MFRRLSSLPPTMALILLIASTACREEKKINVASSINPARMATMTTRNVATLISDSGMIQYKIVAPLWRVYDAVDTPYWDFPQGIYLQKYDPYFHVVATVAADSARFFSKLKVWRLDGNVEMTKVPKDLFLTEQLFWDQRRGKIYSDSFIHIENESHVLEGLGFESDERLSTYRIIKPQGIFPVEQNDVRPGAEKSSNN
ncbi:MAG: LPS export ABC transporter periplasmic protein LptC [Candidatus Amulumruptor caecigallinarius]|nr:LPS export ABC transporter periplasmic protein LptC [Candidatus Amulumruptor caecigallinarius]